MRSRHLAFAALAVLLASGGARADEGARQAFTQGKRLRDEGDCAGAITAFDRSLASERSIGAFYNLGFCHEQLGHRHEAYDAYRSAQELASQKRDGRLREISGAIAALLESPHIRLVLPQPLPDGLQLRVDDELVAASSYAAETVVFTRANRQHAVVVSAPGYEERRLTVETKQVAPVELQRAVPRPVVAAPPPAVSAPPPAPSAEKHDGGAQRTVGLVLGGVGLAAAGVAAFLYANHVSSVHAREDALANAEKNLCSTGEETCLNDLRKPYNMDIQSKNHDAWLTVGVTAGAAAGLLVTGIVLFVKAPSGRKLASSWQIVPTLGGATRGAILSRAF